MVKSFNIDENKLHVAAGIGSIAIGVGISCLNKYLHSDYDYFDHGMNCYKDGIFEMLQYLEKLDRDDTSYEDDIFEMLHYLEDDYDELEDPIVPLEIE